MKEIIIALLNKTAEEIGDIARDLLESEGILKPEEREMVRYIADSLRSDYSPSLSLFQQMFPEIGALDPCAPRLSIEDAKIHLAVLRKRHADARLGRRFSAIGRYIEEDGLTAGYVEELRELTRQNLQCSDRPLDYDYESTFREAYDEQTRLGPGLKTGVPQIDDSIGGMAPGSLTTIMGFTGHYKTTFAVNIAWKNVYLYGLNVAYMSFEVSRYDLLVSLLTRHSHSNYFAGVEGFFHQVIRTGRLDDKKRQYLFDTVAPDFFRWDPNSGRGKLYVLDSSDFASLDMDDMYTRMVEIDKECQQTTGSGIDAFIWDHAQLFKYGTGKSASEATVLNNAINQLMRHALNFRGRKTVQILLSQINREGWKRAVKNGGIYTLTALAEANETERASSVVMAIYADENLKVSNEANVQVLKNRFGQTLDAISVFCDPKYCIFGENVITPPTIDDYDAIFASDDYSSIFNE